MIEALILMPINIFMAWRLSKTEADPDFAMFSLSGFTDSWYGRDFADCKTPMIHLWYHLLCKVFDAKQRDVQHVKFLHHYLMGFAGMVYYLITRDFIGALAFTVLINSGWLWTFTGNVGQIPAALMLLAMAITNPWIACSLFVLAVLFEPKMLFSFVAVAIFKGWYEPAVYWLLFGGTLACGLYIYKRQWFEWLWEAVYTIPKRMNSHRGGLYDWAPWFTSKALLAFMPWVALAAIAKPDWKYWLPAVTYIVFAGLGYVIRPHHLIPLIPWVVLAGIDPLLVIVLVAVDFVSSGFYFGDNWMRFYGTWIGDIREAIAAGLWLKNRPGTLWVNGMHTQVYTYSGKPVQYGLAEQIEIAQVAEERREKMLEAFHANPPYWVV